MTTRKDIADYIHARLQAEKGLLAEEFAASGTIKTCCLDQVLPDQLARTIYDCIPGVNDLIRINPGFPRWIANLMTCLADSAIRINAIPSSQRASPVSPVG